MVSRALASYNALAANQASNASKESAVFVPRANIVFTMTKMKSLIVHLELMET